MASCLIALTNTALADEAINLQSGQGIYPVGQNQIYLEDKRGLLRLRDVVKAHEQGGWLHSQRSIINFGYSRSAYWFYTELNNNDLSAEWFLAIENPLLDEISVFILNDGKVIESYHVGDKYPFHARLINHKYFLVPIKFTDSQNLQIYMRVKSTSAIQVPLKIVDSKVYFPQVRVTSLIEGIYLGILLVMILYNLFIFFSLRDPSYIYYVSYVFMFGLFVMALQGSGFQYLWPNYPNFEAISVLITLPGFTMFLIAFTINFLSLKRDNPQIYFAFLILIFLGLIILMMTFVLPYHVMIIIEIIYALSKAIIVVGVAIYKAREGYSPAKYFLLSFSMLLIGAFMLALSKFGLLPRNIFTENGIVFGSAAEIILLSLALAARIHNLIQERRLIEMENVNIKRKAEVDMLMAERRKMSSVTQMVSGIAHEMNTPVSVCMTAATYQRGEILTLKSSLAENKLSRVMLEEFFEKGIESTDLIIGNLNRASELVKGFKRVAVDLSQEDVTKINVTELLLSLKQFIPDEVRFRIKNHHLNIQCPDNLLLETFQNSLRDVLISLITNSLLHAYDEDATGGIMSIMVEKSNNELLIIYKDNGRGMDKQTLNKVFDPFFTTRRTKGSIGLGLNVVYNLITQQFFGTIECRSEKDVGTTFIIHIPEKPVDALILSEDKIVRLDDDDISQ